MSIINLFPVLPNSYFTASCVKMKLSSLNFFSVNWYRLTFVRRGHSRDIARERGFSSSFQVFSLKAPAEQRTFPVFGS